MTENHQTKGSGEALRKHRENRRARAGVQGQSDEDIRKGTRGTIKDINSKASIVTTIVTTDLDRDRMRKISTLEFEDPTDKVKCSRTRAGTRTEGDFIVTTDSARERMHKISVLGFEDPADRVKDANKSKGNNPTIRKERERRSNSTGRTRTRTENSRVDRGNDRPEKNSSDAAFVPVCGRMERTKSDNSSRFMVPFVVSPDDPQFHRQRTCSLDNDIPMVDVDFLPNASSKQTWTRSLDLEQSFGEERAEGNPEFPPVQVTIPQHDWSNKRKSGGPKLFSGILEPSRAQQQLMRKVSALGMQDPVFGNVHEDMKVNHASMIFEDMDLDDVPKEMRDMVTYASDPKDLPADQVLESPATDETAAMTSSFKSDWDSPIIVDEGDPKDFVPPAGSFVRRVSRTHHGLPAAILAMSPSSSPPLPKDKKSRRPSRGKAGTSGGTKSSSESGSASLDLSSNSHAFIPPTGSFTVRKPGHATFNPDALVKDVELAEQAQSMFAENSLLAMSASSLGQSMSNLNASMPSLNFTSSFSSLNDSCNSEEKGIRRPTGAPPRHTKRSKSPSHSFIPPQSPAQTGRKISRLQPSVESLYSHNMGVPSKSKGAAMTTPGSGSSRPPPSTRRKLLEKTYSSRSWDGDSDLKDPMSTQASPLWASSSQLDTNFPMPNGSFEKLKGNRERFREKKPALDSNCIDIS